MMALRPLSVRGMTPDEAAAAWIVRVTDGPLSSADQAEFDQWITQSPAHDAAFSRAKSAWGLFETAHDDPVMDALRASALAAGPAASRRGLWAGLSVGLAASLLVAVGMGSHWRPFSGPNSGAPTAAQTADKHPSSGEFATARGERRAVQLADGSTVTLNTDSAVRVTYTTDRRMIRLLRGQALFEVAKDASRPFVVQAGAKQVTALGTIFDVRLLDAERLKVTLVEGKVVVDTHGPRANSATPVMVPAVLTPGDTLIIADDAKPLRMKVDVEQQIRWRDGFVEFADATLAEAVREMNRYTGKPIVITDPSVERLRVSGVFRTGNPEHFASVVAELLPVQQTPLAGGGVALNMQAR